MKKLTTEIFIQHAQKIHGNKYDYSKSIYINAHTKIEIICKKHGSFWQLANNHLSNNGCMKCAINKRTKNIDIFIKQSNKIHDNKYDYSKSVYIKSHIKMEIICPIHGSFWQKPNDHLCGHSCKKCSIDRNTSNIFDIIKESNKIHNNKYNYSKSIYVLNGNIKMEIICPIHGSFWQKSWSHISGRGCPICNSSKGEIEVKRILDKKSIKYIQQKKFDECMKIKPLPFDFYLPENNICIEYDGRQHFEPIKMFGGNKAFKIRTENDKIKNQYCYDNGIKLIRIPYWEKNNISNILLNL